MKIFLNMLVGIAAALFLSSCTDFDHYNSGSGYSSYGGSYTTAHVGLIRTSNSYWGYDPYRRSYYDYRCRRYYNPLSRSYCNTAPRRYTTAVYPTGYRTGRPVACPSSLNRVHYKNHRTHSHSNSSSHASGSNRSDQPRYRGKRQLTDVSSSPRSTSSYPRIERSASYRSSTQLNSASVQPVRIHQSISRQPSVRPQPTRSAPTPRSAPRSAPAPKSQPAPSSSGRSSGSAQRSHRR